MDVASREQMAASVLSCTYESLRTIIQKPQRVAWLEYSEAGGLLFLHHRFPTRGSALQANEATDPQPLNNTPQEGILVIYSCDPTKVKIPADSLSLTPFKDSRTIGTPASPVKCVIWRCKKDHQTWKRCYHLPEVVPDKILIEYRPYGLGLRKLNNSNEDPLGKVDDVIKLSLCVPRVNLFDPLRSLPIPLDTVQHAFLLAAIAQPQPPEIGDTDNVFNGPIIDGATNDIADEMLVDQPQPLATSHDFGLGSFLNGPDDQNSYYGGYASFFDPTGTLIPSTGSVSPFPMPGNFVDTHATWLEQVLLTPEPVALLEQEDDDDRGMSTMVVVPPPNIFSSTQELGSGQEDLRREVVPSVVELSETRSLPRPEFQTGQEDPLREAAPSVIEILTKMQADLQKLNELPAQIAELSKATMSLREEMEKGFAAMSQQLGNMVPRR